VPFPFARRATFLPSAAAAGSGPISRAGVGDQEGVRETTELQGDCVTE